MEDSSFRWSVIKTRNKVIRMTNQKKGIHPKGPMGTQNKNKKLPCAQENVSDQVVVGLSLYLIGYDSSGTSFLRTNYRAK